VKKTISYRIFVVRGDDALPITKTAFEDFMFRGKPLSRAFAGQTINIATVVCRVENKKPKEVMRIYCQRFSVRSDGRLDREVAPARSRPATINGAPRTIGADRSPSDGGAPPRMAQTLGMISGAAQKKIFEVLRR
jgi:hypothetical protein